MGYLEGKGNDFKRARTDYWRGVTKSNERISRVMELPEVTQCPLSLYRMDRRYWALLLVWLGVKSRKLSKRMKKLLMEKLKLSFWTGVFLGFIAGSALNDNWNHPMVQLIFIGFLVLFFAGIVFKVVWYMVD